MALSTRIRTLGPALLVAVACSRANVPPPLTEPSFDRAVGLAAFDSAWAWIGKSYYDSTFKGVDWNALNARLRPAVERARHMDDVRHQIDSLFAALGESHFVLIPGHVVDDMKSDSASSAADFHGTLGLDVRLVDGRVLITRVDSGAGGERAGIRTGWEVLAIDDLETSRLLARARAIPDSGARERALLQAVMRIAHAFRGDTGSVVRLALSPQPGTTLHVQARRSPWLGDIVHYGPLPTQYVRVSHVRRPHGTGCLAEVTFNMWMPSLLQKLDSVMTDVSRCEGLLLDLRGNTGGVAALMMGVSGFFVDSAVSLGTYRARVNTLRYMVNPRRATSAGLPYRPYQGSVALLVDDLSASTTEVFADGMRAIGRVRIFGDTTSGQALPATMSRLPGGDLMIHAVADLVSASGRRLEGGGVVPDVILPLRRQDLLAGRDRAREAALEWLRHSKATVGVTTRLPQP